MNKKTLKKLLIITIIVSILLILAFLIYRNKSEYINLSYYLFNRYCEESAPNTVNILLITDSKYVEHMNITIYSLIKNKSPKTNVHIFVIGVGLSNNKIKKIKKTSEFGENVKITVLNNKYNFYKALKIKNDNKHVSQTDLLKFAIPNILQKMDKILYIDGDTIVQNDLSEIYNISIENVYIAAVEDGNRQLADMLNVPKYINNGVMLLNLSNMRKDNIPQKMIRTRFYAKNNRFVTQDTFNSLLYKKTKYIPYKYNCIPIWEDIYGKSCKDAIIIHWAGDTKPWNPKGDCKHKDIYMKYAREYYIKIENEFSN